MAKSKALRVIVDTNLWVSFIISKKHDLLDRLLLEKKVRLLFSAELIAEIEETIKKPKLKNTLAQMQCTKCCQLLNHLLT